MAELPLLNDTIECSCQDCVSACYKKPGWFLPQEIKPVADFLGITEDQLFQRYLSVDYFGNPDEFLFVLSPATENSVSGEVFPLEPGGTCVFLKDNKCSIHSVKPFECKIYDHRKNESEAHLAVAEAWIPFKDYITKLLGREPVVSATSTLEILSFLAGMLKHENHS